MSRAWMPLYVADYLADTGHLSSAEHGAYLLLIMHYWQNGGLPTDDRRLARICRMTPDEWADAKPTIADFFEGGWKHRRIDDELKAAQEISHKAREKAEKRWQKQQNANGNAGADAAAKPAQCQSQPQSPEPAIPVAGATDAAASPDHSIAERELFQRGRAVLGTSAGGTIADLLKAKGGNVALARAAIEQASQKSSPREYVAAIVRQPRGPPHADPARSVHAAARDLVREVEEALHARPEPVSPMLAVGRR
jgi:uncharacterized protein YdaU (DUF1376 family)